MIINQSDDSEKKESIEQYHARQGSPEENGARCRTTRGSIAKCRGSSRVTRHQGKSEFFFFKNYNNFLQTLTYSVLFGSEPNERDRAVLKGVNSDTENLHF